MFFYFPNIVFELNNAINPKTNCDELALHTFEVRTVGEEHFAYQHFELIAMENHFLLGDRHSFHIAQFAHQNNFDVVDDLLSRSAFAEHTPFDLQFARTEERGSHFDAIGSQTETKETSEAAETQHFAQFTFTVSVQRQLPHRQIELRFDDRRFGFAFDDRNNQKVFDLDATPCKPDFLQTGR